MEFLNKIQAFLKGKKTYVVTAVGIGLVLLDFLAGDISLMAFVATPEFKLLLGFLGLGTLRAGVSNGN